MVPWNNFTPLARCRKMVKWWNNVETDTSKSRNASPVDIFSEEGHDFSFTFIMVTRLTWNLHEKNPAVGSVGRGEQGRGSVNFENSEVDCH